ncbi:MAG: DUF2971 domain-containing protein [Desulfuromonadaceae bacterium]|nr:DUF2971 domain-containing protein [Desulfuromonadaceae bacterium]MDD2857005.1 DUF2971 domain-containing protein [Desulfuromonadaceae bacterium]
MRAYHLMSEHWALEALKLRRLKLSLLEDMNDPFELLGITLKKPSDRHVFRKLKTEMNRTIGVLCFSRSWSNPVLWSHYGDRHYGVCLGFDIPDEWAKEVTYHGNRLESALEQKLSHNSQESLGYTLITTKYEHWRYEDEVRMIVRLEDAQYVDDHYFIQFCDGLKLREVITGPRCKLSQKQLLKVVAHEDRNVTTIKGRLAFSSFKVVQKKNTQNA